MQIKVRAAFIAIAAVYAALLAYGIYYLQEELGLEPCPMCILQRYALIAVGVTALVAGVPGPPARGARVSGAPTGLFSLPAGGAGGRPPPPRPSPPQSCGAGR